MCFITSTLKAFSFRQKRFLKNVFIKWKTDSTPLPILISTLKMSKFIMFGYNSSNRMNQNFVMDGMYDNLEECVKMVEIFEKKFAFQYYIVYSSENVGIKRSEDEWKHKWFLKKVLVSRQRFDIDATSGGVPHPLDRCYSNDLKKFYFN